MELNKVKEILKDCSNSYRIAPTFKHVRNQLGITHKELLNMLIVLEQRGYVERYNTTFHRIKLIKWD
jgi:DNA-binding MarR family transcriptional regulator